ncbi:Superfamily I DNA or RNA helicase [Bradyrhizobium sp. Rc2d]|uniref:UvrD-helicase domain-containing protein n=1 Tax=Bradyrhizobium sp. Rc2d TaxID=1855321 RepID=UPI00088C4634|nr:ATP-dependent helicase [Bradyrhizobium sp. Rc2d]SDI86925.1 Superfamily I DNA or RNA helicase [Bradyrhizobium sp. Rc2d]
MSDLSSDQRDVVELPLGPICVTACAGSGKTRTAVHRLYRMRQSLSDRCGIVALLSFSNVAVDTFRTDYFALTRSESIGERSSAVEIETVDGFLTANILRPHGYKAMGCNRTPFLVGGSEPFLKGFKVFGGVRSHEIGNLNANVRNGAFEFSCDEGYASVPIPSTNARKVIDKLGAVGAYTHSLGRYWAIRTLERDPYLLRALSRRYPHILIDEAQDIGPEHQFLLEMLIKNGSQLSLIGDPHQGIYEFSGADGHFLNAYSAREGVSPHSLTVNYRSVPIIVEVANKLSGRSDAADRVPPSSLNGAYYIPYKKAEKDKLLEAYKSMLASANVAAKDASIVCRSTNWVEEWRGGGEAQGQGIIRSFVEATIRRDKLGRFDEAFDKACKGIVGLLGQEHGDLVSVLKRGVPRATAVPLRRAIWSFVRDADSGLPSGRLLAKSEWHPLLKARLLVLLERLVTDFSLTLADSIGQKLANKALLDTPITELSDLVSSQGEPVHVSTVHQVKGESIGAVMYVADRGQVRNMLDGTRTEIGRIGYVAVTRARNLFVLAVPENCIGDFESELVACGFSKAGSS